MCASNEAKLDDLRSSLLCVLKVDADFPFLVFKQSLSVESIRKTAIVRQSNLPITSMRWQM